MIEIVQIGAWISNHIPLKHLYELSKKELLFSSQKKGVKRVYKIWENISDDIKGIINCKIYIGHKEVRLWLFSLTVAIIKRINEKNIMRTNKFKNAKYIIILFFAKFIK